MSTLNLSCQPGNQQVNITLSWSGQAPSGTIDYIVLYYAQGSSQINSKSTQSLNVIINGLTNGTVYNFYAIAYLNSYTNGQRLSESPVVQSVPATVPSAPSNLQAIVSTNGNVITGEVQLSWNASISVAHYPILNYKIYQSLDNATFAYLATTDQLNYNVQNLTNGVDVFFKVTGVSAIGESAQSSSVQAYPSGLASAPLNLVINYDQNASDENAPQGYQSVDLHWNAPLDNGGNPITGYVVQYSLDNLFQSGVTTVNNASTSIDDLQDANLLVPYADTRTTTGWYFFRVCAVTLLGNGEFSELSTITPSSEPSQVINLTASNLDANGQHAPGVATLSWSYNIDNSVPLLGYLISYFEADGTPESIYIYQPQQSPKYTVDQLENGHEYVFNIMAFNSLAMGESSSVAVIPSTVADAPVLSVTGHSSDSISLQWTIPYDQGDAITSFKIFRCVDNINYVEIDEINDTAYTDDDEALVLGTDYYYKVCAVNSNGNGIFSNMVWERPTQAPSAVQNAIVVASNTNASGQQLSLSWDAPLSDGGAPIQYYSILIYSDNNYGSLLEHLLAVSPSVTSYVVNSVNGQSLVNGKSYYFVIRAINRDGFSDSTDEANMINAYPNGLPNPPQITNVMPNAVDGELVITYQDVNVADNNGNILPSDQGMPILQYKLYRDNALIHTFSVGDNEYIDSGLTNGQIYSYQMSAVNANGESAKSASVLNIASTIPDAPNGLQVNHGNNSVMLSWNALSQASNGSNVSPSDQGSAILQYNLYSSVDGSPYQLIYSPVSPSFNVTSLINGKEYSFEVSAVNANGEGPMSEIVTCTPSTSPAVPRSVTLYPYDGGVQISWEDPLSVNGYPNGGLAFDYVLEVADQNGGVAYSGANITERLLDVTGLTNGVTYTMSLYADNHVDTNYIIYNATFQPSADPIAINDLQKTSQNAQQINIQFTYQTAVYNINEYVLSIYDDDIDQAGYAWISASSQSIIAGSNFTYNFAINSATVHMPNMSLNHRLIITMFAINNNGKASPISNALVINP
eukprot:gene309-332_t